MLQKIGFTELALILVVVFLIFGPARLPTLGKSIGEGIREFKKAFKSVGDDDEKQE